MSQSTRSISKPVLLMFSGDARNSGGHWICLLAGSVSPTRLHLTWSNFCSGTCHSRWWVIVSATATSLRFLASAKAHIRCWSNKWFRLGSSPRLTICAAAAHVWIVVSSIGLLLLLWPLCSYSQFSSYLLLQKWVLYKMTGYTWIVCGIEPESFLNAPYFWLIWQRACNNYLVIRSYMYQWSDTGDLLMKMVRDCREIHFNYFAELHLEKPLQRKAAQKLDVFGVCVWNLCLMLVIRQMIPYPSEQSFVEVITRFQSEKSL